MTVLEKTLLRRLLGVIENLCELLCKDPKKIAAYTEAKETVK